MIIITTIIIRTWMYMMCRENWWWVWRSTWFM